MLADLRLQTINQFWQRIASAPTPRAGPQPPFFVALAEHELALENLLVRLSRYHLLILDDIAYVQKDHAGTSVLFELLRTQIVIAMARPILRAVPVTTVTLAGPLMLLLPSFMFVQDGE